MRPAGILAAEMKKFAGCTVTLKTADKTAKASAVMQIMAAGIKCGTQVEDYFFVFLKRRSAGFSASLGISQMVAIFTAPGIRPSAYK